MDWLTIASRVESPNADDRPPNQTIDTLVIHSISLPPGCYENDYVEQFFQNRLDPDEHAYFKEIADTRVSAHLYVRRNGKIIQFVPLHRRAWHAGASSWRGRERCNDFSIGIELEGCDQEAFTASQYASLRELTCQLMSSFPRIGKDNIVGHSDIAPGRKTDPGPFFDWKKYLDSF